MLAIIKSGCKYMGVLLFLLFWIKLYVYVCTVYVYKQENYIHGDHSWLASGIW